MQLNSILFFKFAWHFGSSEHVLSLGFEKSQDYYTNIGAFGFITSFFPSFYIGVQNPRWLFLYFFWKVEARNVVTGRFCWHLDEQKLILLKSTTTFNLSFFSLNFILVVGKVPTLLLAHYNVYWNVLKKR